MRAYALYGIQPLFYFNRITGYFPFSDTYRQKDRGCVHKDAICAIAIILSLF